MKEEREGKKGKKQHGTTVACNTSRKYIRRSNKNLKKKQATKQ